MKMLVACVRSGGDIPEGLNPRENTAKEGEPVIPNFPLGNLGRFLGIRSQGLAYEAQVAESNEDPDALLATLVKTYPGLPQAYLQGILVDTLVAASQKAVPDHQYRVFVTPDRATLQDVKTGDLLPIWTDMNTERYL